jgi:hypothetical protein
MSIPVSYRGARLSELNGMEVITRVACFLRARAGTAAQRHLRAFETAREGWPGRTLACSSA